MNDNDRYWQQVGAMADRQQYAHVHKPYKPTRKEVIQHTWTFYTRMARRLLGQSKQYARWQRFISSTIYGKSYDAARGSERLLRLLRLTIAARSYEPQTDREYVTGLYAKQSQKPFLNRLYAGKDKR